MKSWQICKFISAAAPLSANTKLNWYVDSIKYLFICMYDTLHSTVISLSKKFERKLIMKQSSKYYEIMSKQRKVNYIQWGNWYFFHNAMCITVFENTLITGNLTTIIWKKYLRQNLKLPPLHILLYINILLWHYDY